MICHVEVPILWLKTTNFFVLHRYVQRPAFCSCSVHFVCGYVSTHVFIYAYVDLSLLCLNLYVCRGACNMLISLCLDVIMCLNITNPKTILCCFTVLINHISLLLL